MYFSFLRFLGNSATCVFTDEVSTLQQFADLTKYHAEHQHMWNKIMLAH